MFCGFQFVLLLMIAINCLMRVGLAIRFLYVLLVSFVIISLRKVVHDVGPVCNYGELVDLNYSALKKRRSFFHLSLIMLFIV